MAIFHTSRPVPLGAVSTLRIVNVFDTMVSNFKVWNATRKTTNALRELSDNQLQDIGIERHKIDAVASRVTLGGY